MKIELTEEEREYLWNAPFWDWKRAELDLQFCKNSKMFYDEVREVELEEHVKWYKNLYEKLRGKEDAV